MGYKITLDNNGAPVMSFDPDTTIATDLLLSTLIQQGSFFLDPTLGLRELPKKKDLGIVQGYFEKSVEWLVNSGRAKSIKTTAEYEQAQYDRINVQLEAKQANDGDVQFETFVGVI